MTDAFEKSPRPALGSEPVVVCEANYYDLDSDTKFKGLNKRELFAAMAMQGVLAADTKYEHGPEKLAQWAVEQADYLLAALGKAAP